MVPDGLFPQFKSQKLKPGNLEENQPKKKSKTAKKRVITADDELIFDSVEQYALEIPISLVARVNDVK